MIANFFSKSKPINAVIILLLLFVIFVFSVSLNLNSSISVVYILEVISYFLLLLVLLFGLNFINTKNNLTKDNSYALLLFVLFLGIFPTSALNFKLLIVNLILVFAYRRIYSLRSNKQIKEKLFDSSFWIGLASLIFPWSIFLIVLVYVAIFLFEKSNWRNVFIPLVGLFCPIFIYFIYLYALDDYNSFKSLLDFPVDLNYRSYNSFKLLFPVSIVSGLILWSSVTITVKVNTALTEFKNLWILILSHFMLTAIIALFWTPKDGSEFIFIFFPMAIIFTNYLQEVEENWFKELFLYLFLFLAVFVYVL